jgi:hypothetical protein
MLRVKVYAINLHELSEFELFRALYECFARILRLDLEHMRLIFLKLDFFHLWSEWVSEILRLHQWKKNLFFVSCDFSFDWIWSEFESKFHLLFLMLWEILFVWRHQWSSHHNDIHLRSKEYYFLRRCLNANVLLIFLSDDWLILCCAFCVAFLACRSRKRISDSI